MNAYQLWKMTANPVDPNKRVRNAKLFKKRLKKQSRTPNALLNKRGSSYCLNKERAKNKRFHPVHLKTTDTILLRDQKYKFNRSQRKLSHRSYASSINFVEHAKYENTKPTKRIRDSRHLITSPILQPRPSSAPEMRPYGVRPTVCGAGKGRRKMIRNTSPRRNRASMKWLIQYQENAHDHSNVVKHGRRSSFQLGKILRYKKTNQHLSRPLFLPTPLENRRADWTTRNNIFCF